MSSLVVERRRRRRGCDHPSNSERKGKIKRRFLIKKDKFIKNVLSPINTYNY